MSDNTNNREVASFYFKIAETGENVIIQVPTNICIANFIEYVKNFAYPYFNMDRNVPLEIVEVGQDIPGVLRGEDAPALQRDFDTTVRQLYNGVYENRAFYIRFRRDNQIDSNRENQNTQNTQNTQI